MLVLECYYTRNMSRLFICGFLALLLFSCYKPRFETGYSDENNDYEDCGLPLEIALVQGGKVVLTDSKLCYFERLHGLGKVSKIAIDYAHTKLACKASDSSIFIVDLKGNRIADIPGTKDVTYFDWHANGETLYLLENNKISFYGPEIPVDVTEFTFSQETVFVSSVAISPEGDLLYSTVFSEDTLANHGKVFLDKFDGNIGPDCTLNYPSYTGAYRVKLSELGNQAIFSVGFGLGVDLIQLDLNTCLVTPLKHWCWASAISPDASEVVFSANRFIKLVNSDVVRTTDYQGIYDMDW